MVNRFGSTSDMVIQSVEENGAQYLLAIDEKGLYLTSQKYLDSSLADRSGLVPGEHEHPPALQVHGRIFHAVSGRQAGKGMSHGREPV